MDDFRKSLTKSTLRKVLKRLHYPLEVMMLCVGWYAACPLSFRHIEEMMEERGIVVDHATVQRWAVRILPVLVKIFRSRKRQSKCLNNIVEQDHRAIKRLTRPMMGFKNFPCAKAIIAGIETMHMIHKGQMKSDTKAQALSVSKAKQFYSLPFECSGALPLF
ncbi:MAG: DDE-type integrase/transposase/recombinase [Pseudomonadota bacterium]